MGISPMPPRRYSFEQCSELRALIRDKHRDQFRRLGVARIRRHHMRRARRLEERLAHLEDFDGSAGQLRADLALGDIGGDRARVPMWRGETSRAIEYPHDGDALA